ncbi:hypothetical protein GCM10010954_18310 [Halobacillus andaensis]|uniref:Uncharacterized protein n=1 Tax=Halobacillus andaensis TaxID=1176239 RepID=A0A917B326_HALAA|nr:hypothetical protein [Halobacillus andaensis]MBP2004666.1 hypothetical protein [Halobacillus andaensis]GGF19869.1 hypothetical protein GCM10010954_18310 [Halobacillus andaensis]
MKNAGLFFGLLLTGLFGGQFIIRLLRDGDFYYIEFGIGLVGLILLISSLFSKRTMKEVYRNERNF